MKRICYTHTTQRRTSQPEKKSILYNEERSNVNKTFALYILIYYTFRFISKLLTNKQGL